VSPENKKGNRCRQAHRSHSLLRRVKKKDLMKRSVPKTEIKANYIDENAVRQHLFQYSR